MSAIRLTGGSGAASGGQAPLPGLGMIATSDLVSIVRGRGFSADQWPDHLEEGCGWVPANLALGPFGGIAPGETFGPLGDLRLVPDPGTVTRFPTRPADGEFSVALADITHTDLTPWACCPRTFAKQALLDLHERTGLTLTSAFEHEFVLRPRDADPTADRTPAAPFSLAAFRGMSPFPAHLFGAMAIAGLEPEMVLPEYGANQVEVTVRPASGITSADRAVLLRELVRDVAAAGGRHASFVPLPHPDSVGNGVHVHLSLHCGPSSVMFDPSGPGRLSRVASAFAAGILAHASAITAITAPSPISYLRLRPHRWSAGWAFLGLRHREAMLRITPTIDTRDPAPQLHLEFRAADGTANPWLVLGVLVRAGLAGIEAGLDTPEVIDHDVDALTDAQRSVAGVTSLPHSLDQALQALVHDATAASWFDADLLATYLAVKRDEIALTKDLTDDQRCARYSDVY